MKRLVYDSTGKTLLRTEEAEPKCGRDFCDRCGDCLVCFGSDPCIGPDREDCEHMWVKYEEMEP